MMLLRRRARLALLTTVAVLGVACTGEPTTEDTAAEGETTVQDEPPAGVATTAEAAAAEASPTATATREGEVSEGAGVEIVAVDDESVEAAVERITGAIEASGAATVVAAVDHAAAAEEAGLELEPTTVIIFGNPMAGTPLMQASQTAGIDLPMKMLVYSEASGAVSVAYNDPFYLAARHGITGEDERLEMMATMLQMLATGEGADGPAPSPTATTTPTETAGPSPTPDLTPTASPTETATSSPSPTASPTE